MRRNILIVLLVLLAGVPVFADTAFAADQEVVYAVWARPGQNRNTTIHYARLVGGGWSTPKELALHKGLHVTPVIAVDKKRNIWNHPCTCVPALVDCVLHTDFPVVRPIMRLFLPVQTLAVRVLVSAGTGPFPASRGTQHSGWAGEDERGFFVQDC